MLRLNGNVSRNNSNKYSRGVFNLDRRCFGSFCLSYFMRNLLDSLLQPANWDDREYIEDPNDVKPEVLVVSFHTTLPFFIA